MSNIFRLRELIDYIRRICKQKAMAYIRTIIDLAIGASLFFGCLVFTASVGWALFAVFVYAFVSRQTSQAMK